MVQDMCNEPGDTGRSPQLIGWRDWDRSIRVSRRSCLKGFWSRACSSQRSEQSAKLGDDVNR